MAGYHFELSKPALRALNVILKEEDFDTDAPEDVLDHVLAGLTKLTEASDDASEDPPHGLFTWFSQLPSQVLAAPVEVPDDVLALFTILAGAGEDRLHLRAELAAMPAIARRALSRAIVAARRN